MSALIRNFSRPYSVCKFPKTVNELSRPRVTRSIIPCSVRFRHGSLDVSKMTVVEKIVHDNIKATGPITIADYMRLCLSHPTHGYYTNRDHRIFGKEGDFITSPEISQVFGELIGVWLYSQYMGRRDPIRIIELGPGRGTLMDDMLRVFSKFNRSEMIDVHLVETSDKLRAIQEEKLSPHKNVRLHWHNSVFEIEPSAKEFTFLLAHEFFDALPVHVIQRTSKGWTEVLVAPIEENTQTPTAPSSSTTENESATSPRPPTLRAVLSNSSSNEALMLGSSSKRFIDYPPGSQIEICPTASEIGGAIAKLLQKGADVGGKPSVGGMGLIIDYGGDKAFENSLRAFKNHQIVDMFSEPGECDITTNLDFAYLREAMQHSVSVFGPISQHRFLTSMGIKERTKVLASKSNRKEEIEEATRRLIDVKGMGTQYQFMAITGDNVTDANLVPYPFSESHQTLDSAQ